MKTFPLSESRAPSFKRLYMCTDARCAAKKVCQRDVERELNLRASSVSTLLAGLTSCGYVTRAFAEGDARTKFIELTPKGEQLCLKNRELMDKCDAIIQDALTEEEQVQFKELLIKIFNHIKG